MDGRLYIKTGTMTNYADMPLRSLLPKGIKGVITTGLGVRRGLKSSLIIYHAEAAPTNILISIIAGLFRFRSTASS
jgi:hypothetical protein